MDQENILYRILSGYYFIVVDNQRLKINIPTMKIRQEAHSLYIDCIDDHKYDTDSWISDNIINNLLKVYNIWNDNKEKEYKELIDRLENMKIDLYINFIDKKIREKNKKAINILNKTINDIYQKKIYFDHLKLESYCISLKNQYVIMNCVYDENNNKIFNSNDFNTIDSRFLEKILYEIYNNSLNIDEIKTFAKSDLWKSYWDTKKENIFTNDPMQLTDDQKVLINISKTFDSIKEHLEAPSSEIFNDNDALDGWILHQHKKSEQERKKIEIENKAGQTIISKKSHENIFMMSQDKEQTKSIYSLNDRVTNYQIKSMIKEVNDKGPIETKDFSIFKQQMQNKKGNS